MADAANKMVHLAYAVRSSNTSGHVPVVLIDVGRNETLHKPDHPQENSYWFVFLDVNNPRQKVKEWVVPAKDHSVVVHRPGVRRGRLARSAAEA